MTSLPNRPFNPDEASASHFHHRNAPHRPRRFTPNRQASPRSFGIRIGQTMKQSEIDRELRTIAKIEAKRHGWKSVGGMPYWTIGPFFFVLVQSAAAKEGSFHSSLRFKWLSLDSLLWKVLGMATNEDAPFSLHANGAFALMGQEILASSIQDLVWAPGLLAQHVQATAEAASQRASEVSTKLTSIHAYLDFIRDEHRALMQKHPKAVLNIWKEELLVALETNNLETAIQIANSRCSAGDSGGFISGGKSFFEAALSFCQG